MSTEQNNGMKPAVPPKRSLLSDRRVRLLLSLLGAVIAWMAVTIVVQPGTTTTIYNVRWTLPMIRLPTPPGA